MLSSDVRRLEVENQKLKEEVGRMKQFYGDEYKPKRCQECKLFHQHYVKCGMRYSKINEGYCVAGKRFKKRAAEDERCQFFESKEL